VKDRKKTRWLVAGVIAAFLLGATIAGAVALFAEGVRQATLLALFQKVLQPLGTSILAGLYLWRDFLSDKDVSSRSQADAASHSQADAASRSQADAASRSKANSDAAAVQRTLIQNIQTYNAANSSLDQDELKERIESYIREKGDLTTGVVQAKAFILIDQKERPRIVIGTNASDEPYLTFANENLHPRLTLRLSGEHDAQLVFSGEDGRSITLGIRNNRSFFALLGQDKIGHGIFVHERQDGSVGLVFFDEKGRPCATLDASGFRVLD
jgi:hypothetical protein